jgi:CheY-like chemotaxis protein
VKVLIVDDNEVLTSLLKEILEIEGVYHVETADNGEEGYAASLLFKPDIILTDIEMPVKNGLEMVKDIRAHYPRIKTIYMSSDSDRYGKLLQEEKMKYNARFINKPFLLSEVIGFFHEYQKK